MDTLESLFDRDAALVFGLGGSGDIVGSVPTARLLEGHGVDVALGGITWEPFPKDDRPGPRSLDEIEGIERLNDAVAIASEATRTADGLEFTETAVAGHGDDRVVLIDISGGVGAVRRGLDDAAEQLDLDLVVGVDAGGDVLARGDEPGVRSPVTDGLGLVALDELQTDACLGVFGYGSDGELTLGELEARVAAIAEREGWLGAWGLTPQVADELEALLEHVETEASRVPVAAFRGAFERRSIRGGEVSVDLTPLSPVTLYFDPGPVAETSTIASGVRGTESLDDAGEALRAAGLRTEFDTERERLEGQ